MKHISTSIIVLMFMALFVAGCSGTMGARNLTLTGGTIPSIECKQGESSIEIDKSVLELLSGVDGEESKMEEDNLSDAHKYYETLIT